MSEGIIQPDQPETIEGEGRDLFSKFDDIIALREGLLASGQEDPFNLVMEKVLSPTRAICNGRDTILLGTYNYMGMTFDPDVIAAGKQALDDFGSGTTGSRVLNGTYQGHKECEEALKEFYAMDHAMVFSTGYQANLGIISTIAGKGDLARELGADPELNKKGMGTSFLAQNTGKRSITINLKSEKGQEVFHRLLATSDVLIENFTYEGGDDVIAIKSGWDCFGYAYGAPCKNIHVRNVTAIWTRAAGAQSQTRSPTPPLPRGLISLSQTMGHLPGVY